MTSCWNRIAIQLTEIEIPMPTLITHKLTLRATPLVLNQFLKRHLNLAPSQGLSSKSAISMRLGFFNRLRLQFSGGSTATVTDDENTDAGQADAAPNDNPSIEIGPVIDFETVLPLGGKDASQLWGTPDNATMGRLLRDVGSGTVVIWFDTVSAIPRPIFEAMARQYPELTLEGHAFNEFWNDAARIAINSGQVEIAAERASMALYREVFGNARPVLASQAAEQHDVSKSLGRLTETVAAWLKSEEWTYDQTADQESNTCQFTTGIEISGQYYRVYIDVNEETSQVTIFFYSEFTVPSDRVEEIVVVLNWINDQSQIGRLAVTISDDPAAIQWKAAINVEGSALAEKQVSTLVGTGAWTFTSFAEILSTVALSKMTAEEAIQEWNADRKEQG